METLEAQFNYILERAKASGETRRMEIAREGIRLAVRGTVDETAQHITWTIAKKGRRVSTGDELKYKKLCRVPDTAKRTPTQMGEQERRTENETEWFLIGFRWSEAVP